MNRANILAKLSEIFRDAFDDDSIVISESANSADIENWDSFMQINLIMACETEFRVKFDLKDVISLRNVSSMADVIERKLRQ